MSLIVNNVKGAMGFGEALRELAKGADTLSIGVSYVQIGGWDLLRRQTRGLSTDRMRLLCTDQMNITQPAAVIRAMADGVQVRKFSGAMTNHPKIILAHNAVGDPIRYLVGSANLSYSAFTTSVEAGLLGTDKTDLGKLQAWFDDLFRNRSDRFTPEHLQTMEENWKLAAIARAQARLRTRRGIVIPRGTQIPVAPEDIETLEDIFATLQLPIGLLNFDYAGNNIRSLRRAREVLADWNRVRSGSGTAVKQRSELKLLGFSDGFSLTNLGRAVAAARTEEAVALLWCKWLQQTPDSQLETINPKLLVAKRVFPQFWRFQPDVTKYFLSAAINPKQRRVFQTIELLCNSREIVQALSLDDIRALELLLDKPERLPPHIRGEILDYFNNKGTRGWSEPDRRIVPRAWKQAEGS